MPILPSILSLNKDRSRVPPRAFYGFRLTLTNAFRILKKMHYVEHATFPAGISDKEAYLEAHISTIFPEVVDSYIKSYIAIWR